MLNNNNNCYLTDPGVQQLMNMYVILIEGHLIKISDMKTLEKMDYGFESERHFQNNYASSLKDFRIDQIRNQNFIVPWQIMENEKKEVFVY